MENNKTLRSKYSSKFENIYKSTKVNDGGKIKYKKYNFEPEYIYDEIDDILVIYFSNLEEYFNLKDKILYSTDFTKIFKLNKLKKFLDSNNSKKEKRYFKSSCMIRYVYYLKITNKMIFSKNKIFYDKVELNDDTNYEIMYLLDIYLYPNNNYMNDGTNLIYEFGRNSPDWFYYSHLKKYTHSYGSYFIKNYHEKNRNIIINNIINIDNDIDNILINFEHDCSLIDLESIEKN